MQSRQSRICNSELNYRNNNILALPDIRIKKSGGFCDLEYAHNMKGLRVLFRWLMRTAKNNESSLKTVDISSIAMYQEIHRGITIIFSKISINASNYIKNLLGRNDLIAFFRATGNRIMLYSKST